MSIEEPNQNAEKVGAGQKLTGKSVLIILIAVLIPNLIIQLIQNGFGPLMFGAFVGASLITFLFFLLFNFLLKKAFNKLFRGKMPINARIIVSLVAAYVAYYFIMYLSALLTFHS